MNEDLIQKFGYSEMYEWAEMPTPEFRLGRFVTFDKNQVNKIRPVTDKNDFIVGVTTVNSVTDSDNPNAWKYKNVCNEYGDMYLVKERLAVGEKVYDQINEINFIKTRPWEHYVPIQNKYFNKDVQYVKRTNRQEWIRVNLIGKCVVFDDGQCTPGQWCMPYSGKIKELQGSAIPYDGKCENKFYVLERISDKTILILNK
jgi:hypothetical protein